MDKHETKSTAGSRVIVTTSWDDGHKLDIRLADLLLRYGIRGTFYIAPEDFESTKDEHLTENEMRNLSLRFEIGAHTMTHRSLPKLSQEEALKEIVDSKKYLEQVTGHTVTSFCYPRGEYNKQHVRMVRDAGFLLARTVKRFVLTPATDFFELPTSIHTYDHYLDVIGVFRFVNWNPFRFMHFYRKWDALAIAMFDTIQKEGGVFHLWGHSWELESHGDWERLERVLAHIAHKEGVAYLTNGELATMTYA